MPQDAGAQTAPHLKKQTAPVATPAIKILPAIAVAAALLISLSFWLGSGNGAATPAPVPVAPEAERPLHPTVVHKPAGPPRVATGQKDFLGKPVTVACATCHTTREPDLGTRAAADLDTFHQGLVYAHGDQSCLSCHNAKDYDTLRLADGRALPFTEVKQLCAQCHGTQARDFEHGAHGGMAGHWDLRAGPRTRNTCTDCHDPHAPAYPTVAPVFAPRDRVPGRPVRAPSEPKPRNAP